MAVFEGECLDVKLDQKVFSNYGLGRLEGKEEGKEEGREEGKLVVARRLIARGMTVEEAAEVVGVSVEVLRKREAKGGYYVSCFKT